MDHTRLDGRSYTTTPSRAMLAANSGLDVRLGSTTSIRYVIDKSSNGDVSHVSQLCTFPQATRFPLPKLVQPRYATNQLEPCGVASSTRGCSRTGTDVYRNAYPHKGRRQNDPVAAVV